MAYVSTIKGLDDVRQALRGMERQIPQATAWAVNGVADEIKRAEVREMRARFDRPTPYTLNALRVRYARKRDPKALVWFKDESFKGIPATKYLTPQVQGGERSMKRSERALQRVGVLPKDMMIVPGQGADLDAYGNVRRGQLIQIISYFRAFGQQGYTANMTDHGRAKLKQGRAGKSYGFEYFVAVKGKTRLHPGIWMRVGTGFGKSIKPVLMFVDSPRYKETYDFFGVAARTHERTMPRQMARAIAKAIRTAR